MDLPTDLESKLACQSGSFVQDPTYPHCHPVDTPFLKIRWVVIPSVTLTVPRTRKALSECGIAAQVGIELMSS